MKKPRRSILVLARQPWLGPLQTPQQLFSRLAVHHEIVYSVGIPFFKGFLRHRPFSALRGHLERMDGLLVDHPPSWLIRNFRVRVLDDLALALAARRWRHVLPSKYIAYIFSPSSWPHVRYLKPSRVVYHAFDLYDRQASWVAEFAAWERELIARADLVIASSSVIRDRLVTLGATSVMLLENAADYSLFAAGAEAPEPADLSPIPRPRVGFAGAINEKIDMPLMAALALRLPALHFVMIGRVGNLSADMQGALTALRERANVHLLGPRDYTDVPAYVAHMDVNVICNRLDAGLWTEGTYPLKLHEYLATGLPVVASDLPAVRQFTDSVRVAAGVDEWVEALVDAVAGRGAGTPESRRAVARANTWDRRAAELEAALVGLCR